MIRQRSCTLALSLGPLPRVCIEQKDCAATLLRHQRAEPQYTCTADGIGTGGGRVIDTLLLSIRMTRHTEYMDLTVSSCEATKWHLVE